MKIRCFCLFDITHTGVLNHYKVTAMPFYDRSGALITNDTEWRRSRNQQRNWETIIQLLSLRCQPMDLSDPVLYQNQDLENYRFGTRHQGAANIWTFEFVIEQLDIFREEQDELSKLRKDFSGVPMVCSLGESAVLDKPVLDTSSENCNIYFSDK